MCDFKGTETDDPIELLNGLPNLRGSSFGRLIEDALPLLANSSLRERVLRIDQDYMKYWADYLDWTNLLRDSSRPIQWGRYNLSGISI